jgi:methyl-accepting chemotaxis protein
MDGNWQLVQASAPLAESVDRSFAGIEASLGNTVQEVKTAEPVLQRVFHSGREIFDAVEGINEIAQNNGAFAEEVMASSDESAASIREMVAATQELKDIADDLLQLVGKFIL